MARYTEDPVDYVKLLTRLKQKFYTARKYVPSPVVDLMEGANIGIIAFGSTDPAILEARDQMVNKGIETDYLRVRAIPFSTEVSEFIERHDRNYIIEMNRDGQLHQLLTLEYPEKALNLVSIAYSDGFPLTARFIENSIVEGEVI
jgi:2-oxoglutarate ferredoxin oxidoreductase subunit alpha